MSVNQNRLCWCGITDSDVVVHRFAGLYLLLCTCAMAVNQAAEATAELPATRYSDDVTSRDVWNRFFFILFGFSSVFKKIDSGSE